MASEVREAFDTLNDDSTLVDIDAVEELVRESEDKEDLLYIFEQGSGNFWVAITENENASSKLLLSIVQKWTEEDEWADELVNNIVEHENFSNKIKKALLAREDEFLAGDADLSDVFEQLREDE